MPNVNTFKCDACRKDFKNVWLPNKLCCRLAQNGRKDLRNTYSRHFTQHLVQLTPETVKNVTTTQARPKTGESGTKLRNNIAPFSSSGKPTCGHFFSRETDHRKRKIGIPPSNLVQWRSYVS